MLLPPPHAAFFSLNSPSRLCFFLLTPFLRLLFSSFAHLSLCPGVSKRRPRGRGRGSTFRTTLAMMWLTILFLLRPCHTLSAAPHVRAPFTIQNCCAYGHVPSQFFPSLSIFSPFYCFRPIFFPPPKSPLSPNPSSGGGSISCNV